MNTRRAHRWATTAAVGSLAALVVTKLVFGVGPVAAVKHAPWYAFGYLDSVPIWMETRPMLTGQTPWDMKPTGDGVTERVEAWSVSSADVRDIMQKHRVLTAEWREKVTNVIRNAETLDDPLLTSYPAAMGKITQEFVQLIPDDVLLEKATEIGAPGLVHASGCAPDSNHFSSFAEVFYNTAPRRSCDNVVGAILWLLFGSMAVLAVGYFRSRSRRT